MIRNISKRLNIDSKPIKGFLLDVNGVLYDNDPNGVGCVIPGSVEAFNRLYVESQIRLVTNQSMCTRKHLAEKLKKLGFRVNEEHIFMPVPEAKRYIKTHDLRPHIFVHNGIAEDFKDLDTSNPNCILMGDAQEGFTYKALNTAFRILHKMNHPLIITLGCGKFYQRKDGPCIDVGSFARVLEYASNAQIIAIGKPNEQFFKAAIEDMGLTTDEVVMIGDDIVSDIGGAMKAGIRSVQVRTGKWRESWLNHIIKPNLIIDDLKSAVEIILKRE